MPDHRKNDTRRFFFFFILFSVFYDCFPPSQLCTGLCLGATNPCGQMVTGWGVQGTLCTCQSLKITDACSEIAIWMGGNLDGCTGEWVHLSVGGDC